MDRVYMTFVQATTGSGRLADERLADARSRAVLRRHLLPAGVAVGPAGLRRRAAGDRAAVAGRARARRCSRRGGARQPAGAQAEAAGRAGCPGPAALDARCEELRRAFDPQRGGLRRRAEVPAAVGTAVPAARVRRAPASRRPADMARRRRCARWRAGGMRDQVGGGFHRYSVDAAVARAALREDALRPGAARARLPRGRAGDGDGEFADVAEDTLRVRPARHDRRRAGASTRPRTPTACRPANRRRSTSARARSTCGRLRRSTRLLGDEARAVPAAVRHSSQAATRRRIPHGEFAGRTILCTRRGPWRRSRRRRAAPPTEISRRACPRRRRCSRRAHAAAAAPRRQGPDGVERPDDRGLRARGEWCSRRRRLPQAAVRAAAVHPRPCSGTRPPAGCSGGTATARRPSTRTRRTTPT